MIEKQCLVVATKNKKKLQELKDLLREFDLEIVSLESFKKTPRIIENGKTFKENAVKKAVKIAHFTKALTLGEDSGLCVDALGGKPG
ncbi:MAG: non-canonical purine NTP pyrophosphatase, partial [Candidatus Omnitrophica bacterium]|nr:non-canonical purine NTP pyrophosphatase [Candidatus Omnitrophota bacterium]